VAEHKPLVVGLDIAKIAGRGESDSFIALRTWWHMELALNCKNMNAWSMVWHFLNMILLTKEWSFDAQNSSVSTVDQFN
jgi:hypothetical protein